MKYLYFNYWWFVVISGFFFVFIVLVYIEDYVGFGWGYGIFMVGLVFVLVVFFFGICSYCYKYFKGSFLI